MQIVSSVPALRVRSGHGDRDAPIGGDGGFVLYWMTAFRRSGWNFALERAVDWGRSLGKPVVVLEALRIDYRWASDRFHTFVAEGMRDNAEAFGQVAGVFYYPYLEPARGAAAGLLESLARRASVVVGDDFPSFFLPAQARAARRAIPCRYELIDANGLYPLRGTDKVFARAFDFRRHLQKELAPHLLEAPKADPFAGGGLPEAAGLGDRLASELARWPAVSPAELADPAPLVARLPIDHRVGAVPREPGGPIAAGRALDRFLSERFEKYGELRNEPEVAAASELSAYLHWGHLSASEIFARVARLEGWTPAKLARKPTGAREGWWGMSPTAESFLDELVTWREVGFNMSSKRPDHARFESLPDWSRQTLAEHASDPREHVYTLDDLEHARTHDDLWNAAQRQLTRDGRVHNYLRMLWGKKILEWSASPRDALDAMIELNNKYALDGRNPNSYSGIFWVLGRYDRAWGPERPVYGKIRYMSSDNTARKVRVKDYLKRYGADGERSLF